MHKLALSVSAVSLVAFNASCTEPIPQTETYCLDVPTGEVADVQKFVKELASQLDSKVAERHFDNGDNGIRGISGVDHQYMIFGRGVTVLVQSSMISGATDEYGNAPTKFTSSRYGVSAFESGWFPSIELDEVMRLSSVTAKSNHLILQPALGKNSCAM